MAKKKKSYSLLVSRGTQREIHIFREEEENQWGERERGSRG